MQARYYDPVVGRFLSNDPVGFVESNLNPQMFNRYSYTWNDPINLIDPYGLNPNDCNPSFECHEDNENNVELPPESEDTEAAESNSCGTPGCRNPRLKERQERNTQLREREQRERERQANGGGGLTDEEELVCMVSGAVGCSALSVPTGPIVGGACGVAVGGLCHKAEKQPPPSPGCRGACARKRSRDEERNEKD